jgi:hypothetical protein
VLSRLNADRVKVFSALDEVLATVRTKVTCGLRSSSQMELVSLRRKPADTVPVASTSQLALPPDDAFTLS